MSFIITVDSGCYASSEYIKENDVRVISYSYSVNENIYSDTNSSLNNARSKHCCAHAIEISDYVDFWRRILSEGKPVVHISTGSGFDRSCSNALAARDILRSQSSEGSLFIIDSRTLSCGCTMLLHRAVSLRSSGHTAQQCAAALDSEKFGTRGFLILSDASSMYKAGRVRLFSHLRTALTKERLILYMHDGILKNNPVYSKNPVKDVASLMKENEISADKKIYISHNGSRTQAEALSRELCNELGAKCVEICEMSTSQSIHAGFGAIAVFFRSNCSEDSIPLRSSRKRTSKPAYL